MEALTCSLTDSFTGDYKKGRGLFYSALILNYSITVLQMSLLLILITWYFYLWFGNTYFAWRGRCFFLLISHFRTHLFYIEAQTHICTLWGDTISRKISPEECLDTLTKVHLTQPAMVCAMWWHLVAVIIFTGVSQRLFLCSVVLWVALWDRRRPVSVSPNAQPGFSSSCGQTKHCLIHLSLAMHNKSWSLLPAVTYRNLNEWYKSALVFQTLHLRIGDCIWQAQHSS